MGDPVWFDHYAGEYDAQDDEDALAQAYAKGRGGNQLNLNAPDPVQVATGRILPLGTEPIVTVDVPAPNARTWVITLLGMRLGFQNSGVAIVAGVPLDNQASDFTNIGVYASMQYGTAEAQE